MTDSGDTTNGPTRDASVNAAPKKKLIETSLPLEAINFAAAREKKSIRKGLPLMVHLYWARRPISVARAVLFAQLVDDPASRPEEFPTVDAQDAERARLHRLLERLIIWENSNDDALLAQARAEIRKSNDGKLPSVLDPFAGGGAIPLEAQRLGLEAHASDLNPVAVLINKALIEIRPTTCPSRRCWDPQCVGPLRGIGGGCSRVRQLDARPSRADHRASLPQGHRTRRYAAHCHCLDLGPHRQ